MKPISMLCLSFLLSASATAHADELAAESPEAPVRDTVLGLSFAPDDLGAVTLEGERVVGPRMSVGVGVRVGLTRGVGSTKSFGTGLSPDEGDNDYHSYVLGVGPRVRFFLSGTAPEGVWLSPGLEVSYLWRSIDNGPDSLRLERREHQWGASGVLLIGYTAILGKGLVLQAGVGGEVRHDWFEYESHTRTLGVENPQSVLGSRIRQWTVSERLALTVGWAF
ncbi:hypothetical protein LY474_13575 [Myxococcus stipitatus]|uniref:hypothetical protein n=1 Tax=Myxococcus stipitatus TaxID=83455 RepID=UPI001F184F75|nr:hypothetical protein [Myxococcus stipitatus]MCE9668849.1 hypothetical protein [Myxococcus stipitatus]